MEHVLANFAGKTHRLTWGGREFAVAPLTMIVPGVLSGSKGPLLYPEDEVAKDPSRWNHVPIVNGHPTQDGKPVSARDPDILEKHGLGYVFRSAANGKLTAEGWFDVEATRRVAPRVLDLLAANKPFELSTGLFTDDEPADEGATHNGREYAYVARNYRPDHLAVLLDDVGACSLKDGCGVLVNADEKQSLWQKLGALLGIPSGAGTAPQPAANAAGDPPMKLTDAQRGEHVAYLTANCACWKDAAEVLNGLADDRLVLVRADAEKAAQLAATANAATSPPAVPAPVPPAPLPAANESRLTAEEREDLAFARAEKTRQKQALVGQLTANVDEAERAASGAALMAKSLDELRFLVKLLPPAATPTPAPVDNYFGAAGVPSVAPRGNPDNLLPVETIDFTAMASERLRKLAS